MNLYTSVSCDFFHWLSTENVMMLSEPSYLSLMSCPFLSTRCIFLCPPSSPQWHIVWVPWLNIYPNQRYVFCWQCEYMDWYGSSAAG